MQLNSKKMRGFTLIEISLVIIVMGILASAIAPMLAGIVGRTQADAEHAKLKGLKEALLADALEKGGFVDPLTTATVLASNTPNAFAVVQPNRYLPASANGLALGLSITSGFNNAGGDISVLNAVPQYYDGRPASLLYDVHTNLTRTVAAVAATPLSFCANAAAALAAPAASPEKWVQVCQRAAGSDALVACQAADQKVQAAMVLVSRGKNRQFEFENLEGFNASGTAALAVTAPPELLRTYESPNRGVNYSNDVGAYYDDAVESISISEVVSACQKRGILTTTCPADQRKLTVVNGYATAMSIKLNGACSIGTLLPGQPNDQGCRANTDSVELFKEAASCTTAVAVNGFPSRTILDINTNGDGSAQVFCDSTPSCTGQ